MTKILQVLWVFTAFIFMAFFLYTYAALPESVKVGATWQSTFEQFITKDAFFFYTLSAFVAVTLFWFLLRWFLQVLPVRQGTRGFWRTNRQKTVTYNWFMGLGMMFNVILFIGLLLISVHNRQDSSELSIFIPLTYAPLVLLMGWLIGLPVVLSKR